MKTRLLLAALLAALPLNARERGYQWDPFPLSANVDGVLIYIRGPIPGDWYEVARVPSIQNFYVGEFPDTEYEISLKSFRLLKTTEEPTPPEFTFDGNQLETSERSAILTIPTTPPAPTVPRIRVTVEVQASEDLTAWLPISQTVLPEAKTSMQFVRLAHPHQPENE